MVAKVVALTKGNAIVKVLMDENTSCHYKSSADAFDDFKGHSKKGLRSIQSDPSYKPGKRKRENAKVDTKLSLAAPPQPDPPPKT